MTKRGLVAAALGSAVFIHTTCAALGQDQGHAAPPAVPTMGTPKTNELLSTLRSQIKGARAITLEGTVTQTEEAVGKTLRPPKAPEFIEFKSKMAVDKIRTEVYDSNGNFTYAFSSVGGRIREFVPRAHVSKRSAHDQANVLLEYDGTPGIIERCALTDNGCYFGACTTSWFQREEPGMEVMLLVIENSEFVEEAKRGDVLCYHFSQTLQLDPKAKADLESVKHDVYVAKNPLRLFAWETQQRRADGLHINRAREYKAMRFITNDSEVNWEWELDAKKLRTDVRPAKTTAKGSPDGEQESTRKEGDTHDDQKP